MATENSKHTDGTLFGQTATGNHTEGNSMAAKLVEVIKDEIKHHPDFAHQDIPKANGPITSALVTTEEQQRQLERVMQQQRKTIGDANPRLQEALNCLNEVVNAVPNKQPAQTTTDTNDTTPTFQH
jgi:hypothetical protein